MLVVLKESGHIRSNVIDYNRNAKAMLASEDMLKKGRFTRALHSQQQFHGHGSRRPTKNPERSVTGRAFGGMLGFLAPLLLFPFLTLFLAILN